MLEGEGFYISERLRLQYLMKLKNLSHSHLAANLITTATAYCWERHQVVSAGTGL
jgi:hypothetical protein